MFKVEWVASALDDLAMIWLEADANERNAITRATNDLERRLSSDPEAAGESRPDNRRIMFLASLGVMLHIDFAKRIVTVVGVWRFARRDP